MLNSNDEELQGLDMKALRQRYDGAWEENDNGIIAVPYKMIITMARESR